MPDKRCVRALADPTLEDADRAAGDVGVVFFFASAPDMLNNFFGVEETMIWKRPSTSVHCALAVRMSSPERPWPTPCTTMYWLAKKCSEPHHSNGLHGLSDNGEASHELTMHFMKRPLEYTLSTQT